MQRRPHLAHEAGTQQQILWRIAGNGQFGEYDHISPQPVAGFNSGGDDFIGIAGNIADQKIKLGHDDPEGGSISAHGGYLGMGDE